MKTLTVTSGPLKGRIYEFEDSLVIGRGGDCAVRLNDSGSSRKHAILLSREDGSVVLRDLASRNGTKVGDDSVHQRPLNSGDTFSIGETGFIFQNNASSYERAQPEVTIFDEDKADHSTDDQAGDHSARRKLLSLARSLKDKRS